MKVNSNITFKGLYTNKTLKKGLELAADNGALFAASAMLVGSTVIRPAVIMATPNTDVENKKIACAKSYASSIASYLLMFALSKPLSNAIKKIDKNPSKYLAKDTISNLKEPHKSLVNSKPYILATQIFKLGSGLIAAAPKAMITATGVPYIMNTVFPQKQNNPTFKGKNDKVVRKIGHIIDNKKIQDFSKKYQNSNFPMHITALTDILTTGIFVQQTYKNQKIDNNRKKTLAYNAEISTGLSLISAYTVDKALSKPTERFIEKFSKLNKGQPNLEKQIEGIKIAKPILILAGIYYTAIPLLSTFIADRVGIRK